MRVSAVILFMVLLVASSTIWAEDFQSLVRDGDSYFENKQYRLAVDQYRKAFSLNKTDYDLAIKYANTCYLVEDLDSAIKILNSAKNLNPSAPESYELLGLIYQDKKEYLAAIGHFKNVLKSKPTDFLTSYRVGKLYYSTGDYKNATDWLLKADAIMKDDPRVLKELGKTYFRLAKYEDAIAQLERIKTGTSEAAEASEFLKMSKLTVLNKQGDAAFEKGEFDSAIESYSSALKLKEVAGIFVSLGSAYLKKKDFVKAKEIYKKALKLDENNSRAFEGLAITMKESGDTAGSDELMKKLEIMKRTDPSLSFKLGAAAEERQELESAVQYYRESLAVDSGYKPAREAIVLLYYNMGVAGYNKNDFPSALTNFKHALRVDADFTPAQEGATRSESELFMKNLANNLAVADKLLEEGSFEEASRIYEKALLSRTNDPVILLKLGNAYLDLEKYKEALDIFMKLLAQSPQDKESCLGAALAQTALKKYDEARQLLERVVQIDPEDARAYNYIGDAYCEQGFYDKANEYYLKGGKGEAGQAYAYFNIGNVNYKQKKYDEAEEYYGKFLELEPDNEIALYNLAVIYYKKQKLPESMALLKKLESTLGATPEFNFSMGKVLYYSGNHPEALKYFLKACELKNGATVYRWGLANVYLKLYETEKDAKKREEYRKSAMQIFEECLSGTNPEIAGLARFSILKVDPDRVVVMPQKEKEVAASPVLEKGDIYFVARGGDIMAVRANSGETVWKISLDETPTLNLVIGSRWLYVPFRGKIIGLEKSSAAKAFEIPVEAIGIDNKDDVLYCLLKNGVLECYEADKRRWRMEIPGATGLFIGEQLTVHGKNRVALVDPLSGENLWNRTFTNQEIVRCVDSRDAVALELKDTKGKNTLCVVDKKTANNLWTADSDKLVQMFGFVDFDRLVLLDVKGNLKVLNRDSGVVVWQKKVKLDTADVFLKRDRLYTLLSDNSLVVLDWKTGDSIWEYKQDDLLKNKIYSLTFKKK